ncbi:hypothetical protein GHI93_04930 [Lactococcus hircilactis]|uniref:Uncharacterized protein n=1 Tax=Lactococcus hircilactis TaxID=1494462 RepID=A0A7X1Z7T8_9LACT|nr:hypothetical protein [Lactococcus hircilactis]MQW39282.1 hypothetical protein [Lactococcus hircilactis]
MDTKNIINTLKSSKYLMREKRYIFIGVVMETIFSRELFTKNNDLHEYIHIFENLMKLTPYRDYLYKSRTMLASRVIKDLLNKEVNADLIRLMIDKHIDFIEKYVGYSDKKKSTKKSESSLLEDMIRSNSEKTVR